MAWNGKVPFVGNEQQTYVETWLKDGVEVWRPTLGMGEVTWVDNHTFSAELSVQGYCKGRSAAYVRVHVNWVEHDSLIGKGDILYMTLATLTKLLTDDDTNVAIMLRNGKRPGFLGTFTFAKRGQNYYCEVVDA